jgi:hypothetical protein
LAQVFVRRPEQDRSGVRLVGGDREVGLWKFRNQRTTSREIRESGGATDVVEVYGVCGDALGRGARTERDRRDLDRSVGPSYVETRRLRNAHQDVDRFEVGVDPVGPERLGDVPGGRQLVVGVRGPLGCLEGVEVRSHFLVVDAVDERRLGLAVYRL